MSLDLNERAQEIFREIVDSYLESGDPQGSRTISKRLGTRLSPATIRNVMADLQEMDLLYSPHTSGGRLPTERGLRFYVDTLMGDSALSVTDKERLEQECASVGLTVQEMFERTSRTLSGLSSCAGLVLVPKREAPLRHIEFVSLEPGRALAVMVLHDGTVENRLIDVPREIVPGELKEASNYLQHMMYGKTLAEMQSDVDRLIEQCRRELGQLQGRVVEAGLALKPDDKSDLLIFQGAANILQGAAIEDVASIQRLFDLLEKQETATQLLRETEAGEGVQIYIGSENNVLQNSNLSMVVSAYRDENKRIVGATGVIGPTRLNYRKVIPMVDYTARLMGQLITRTS